MTTEPTEPTEESEEKNAEHPLPASHYAPPEINLIVDEKKMKAEMVIRGRFHPGYDYGHFIRMLDEDKIVFGVDTSALRQLEEEYAAGYRDQGRRTLRKVVAEGYPPEPPQDGKIEILIPDPPAVNIDEQGRADFRNIQKFVTVDEGTVLARFTPPIEGKSGTDVYGDEIKPRPARKPVLEAADNVKFKPETNEYVATKHGIFVKGERKIAVSPVLVIPASVGLSSGNVNYDGNVKIGGNVERGSMVSCYADCDVGGMVETGDMRVGGTLRVQKGINTRQEGMLNVGGNLQTTYVENTTATVEGSLIVQKSIINSKLVCYADLIMTTRGATITGGEILIFGSVTTDVLGNKTEIPTRLIVGAHHKNTMYYDLTRKELDKVEKDFEKKVEEINKIKQYVQRMRGKIPVDKQAALRVKYREYKEMTELRERLQQQIVELRESRYNPDEVRVIIRDVAHPGVTIHYRDYVEKITAPLTKCVLRFRPGYGGPEMQGYRIE